MKNDYDPDVEFAEDVRALMPHVEVTELPEIGLRMLECENMIARYENNELVAFVPIAEFLQ